MDVPELLDLLRRAEPEYAAGLFTERTDDRVTMSVVFAYRRGGAWSLLSSKQGVRISDAHTLWSSSRGTRRWGVDSPPGYHSGGLRDMLVPRWRDLWPEFLAPRMQLVGPVRTAHHEATGRPAWEVEVAGGVPDWTMLVDKASGVVLRDVHEAGSRELTLLHLDPPLHPDLFTWHSQAAQESDADRGSGPADCRPACPRDSPTTP